MDANKPLIEHFPGKEVLFPLMGLYYNELFRYGIKFIAGVEGTKDALNQFFIHFWDNRYKPEKVDNLKGCLFWF